MRARSGVVGVALGGGDLGNDLLEDVGDARAGLAARGDGVVAVEPDDLLDLVAGPLHVARGQVDLVQNRNDLEPLIESQVHVRQRLRLDALRRVDDQDRAFASGERARDLVAEVDVAWRVDEIELVSLPVLRRIFQARVLRLDGDASLALQIHLVEELGPRLAVADRPGDPEDAIGQGAFPVVDVRDDREVPDEGLRCRHERGLVYHSAALPRSGAPSPYFR